MISLTSEELKKLEKIGYGNFGVIYKDSDKIYKIYNHVVKASAHITVPNPSLRFPKRRLNRLINLNKSIKYTDLVQDTVFIDGQFRGIVLPYYEGETLLDLSQEPLEKRLTICSG